MSSADIHELNEKAKGVFDVRKIRSGQAYAVFTVPDSTRRSAFSFMRKLQRLMSFLTFGESVGCIGERIR